MPTIRDKRRWPENIDDVLILAELCAFYEHSYLLGYESYIELFRRKPQSADDMDSHNRYNAACCACLAAAGGGNDAGHLGDQDRANLRRQAATWLGAELSQLKTRLLRGNEGDKSMIKKRLSHWTTDPDLRSVRDATELGKLPGETAQEWKVFWSEVAEVLKLVKAAT